MKKVYFVRHGETIGNIEKCFQFPDTELSDAGHRGGKAVGERFQNVRVDQIIASPYVRTQQTAQYISDIKNVPIETLASLHEKLHKESIRGKGHESEDGALYMQEQRENFWNTEWSPEGAENFSHVIERVSESIAFVEQSNEKNIVVVSHADFIKSMSAYLLAEKNKSAELNRPIYSALKKMSNVGITEFEYSEGKWKLFMYNDHAHFAE